MLSSVEHTPPAWLWQGPAAASSSRQCVAGATCRCTCSCAAPSRWHGAAAASPQGTRASDCTQSTGMRSKAQWTPQAGLSGCNLCRRRRRQRRHAWRTRKLGGHCAGVSKAPRLWWDLPCRPKAGGKSGMSTAGRHVWAPTRCLSRGRETSRPSCGQCCHGWPCLAAPRPVPSLHSTPGAPAPQLQQWPQV